MLSLFIFFACFTALRHIAPPHQTLQKFIQYAYIVQIVSVVVVVVWQIPIVGWNIHFVENMNNQVI